MSDSINTTQAMDKSPYQSDKLENDKFKHVPSLGVLVKKNQKSLKSLEPNLKPIDKYQPSMNQKNLKPLI